MAQSEGLIKVFLVDRGKFANESKKKSDKNHRDTVWLYSCNLVMDSNGKKHKVKYVSVPNYAGSTSGSKKKEVHEDGFTCGGTGKITCTRCGGSGKS